MLIYISTTDNKRFTMLHMKRGPTGEVVYHVEEVERAPLSRVDQEQCKLRPKLRSPYIAPSTWVSLHKPLLEYMLQRLYDMFRECEPPMRWTIQNTKLRNMFYNWAYMCSDNRHKKYRPFTA